MSESAAPERFREPPDGSSLWQGPWLVRCPRCDEQATVSADRRDGTSRLVCTHCGFARDGGATTVSAEGALLQAVGRREHHVGRARAPRPRRDQDQDVHPFWLQEPCCGGEVLWAANPTHLAYLRAYVAADLREGKNAPNKTLQHYLPGWLKDAKHRDEVLRALDRLEARLA